MCSLFNIFKNGPQSLGFVVPSCPLPTIGTFVVSIQCHFSLFLWIFLIVLADIPRLNSFVWLFGAAKKPFNKIIYLDHNCVPKNQIHVVFMSFIFAFVLFIRHSYTSSLSHSISLSFILYPSLLNSESVEIGIIHKLNPFVISMKIIKLKIRR